MSEDDYEDLMRLRDLELRLNAGNGNDEAKGGEPRDQRVMEGVRELISVDRGETRGGFKF